MPKFLSRATVERDLKLFEFITKNPGVTETDIRETEPIDNTHITGALRRLSIAGKIEFSRRQPKVYKSGNYICSYLPSLRGCRDVLRIYPIGDVLEI